MMQRVAINFLTFLLLCVVSANGAKIAVFNNFFTHSHTAFLSKLADVLAEHGHNVTVITCEVDTTMNFPYPKKANHMVQAYLNKSTINVPEFTKLSQANLWIESYNFIQKRKTIAMFRQKIESQCERLLKNSEFVARVAAEKFEFALTEPMDYCGYGFIKLAGIPAYANSIPMAMAGQVARALGLDGPLFEPFPIASGTNNEMSFHERLTNKLSPFFTINFNGMDIRDFSVSVVQKLVDPNFTSAEAISNGRYIFFNTEEHIDFPRPISHKIVYIGGITVNQDVSTDNLPQDYHDIFDNAKKGVVFVSFGSIARSSFMPEHIKSSFLKLFAAYPDISFIWKYENPEDEIANDLPNVFKKTWVPQKEVLAHPKLLAFVTHGGMNSVLEGALFGVPLLGVPLFADQYRNVKMLEYRGTSVIVKKGDVTPNALITALQKLTETDEHRIRAREIAQIIRLKPIKPTQIFMNYMNHAIAFSNTTDYLDIDNRKLNTVKYFELDVYAFFAVVTLFIVTIAVKFVLVVLSTMRLVYYRAVGAALKKNV